MARSVPALDLRFAPTPDLADRISTALHELGPAAVHELGPDEAPLWRVFFTSHASRDVASRVLAETLGGEGVQVSVAMVEDEDWAQRSQAGLPRVRVGRLIVAPPWDVPVNPAPGETVIRITPSMGFGTGHHETTRLCLGLLQRVDCRGLRVIDAGTGSGVLAIAAALLGARHVTAFDVDADAVACARDNLRDNFPGPESSTVHVRIAALGDDRPAGDIVLANLTGTALVRGAASLLAQTAPGGRLILSGLLAHEQDTVLAAFQDAAVTEVVEGEGEWRAVLLRRS